MTEEKINYRLLIVIAVVFSVLLNFSFFDDPQVVAAFALLIAVAALWISEAIPLALTALLIPLAAAVLGLLPPDRLFREFSNPILFLFMGGFVLAGALSRHGLDKYFAGRLISLAKGNFYWSSVLLMLGTALIGCWVSNTSSVAMMIPLAMGILVLLKKDCDSAESSFLLLGIAYSASVGGIITIIGSPPNGIGAALVNMSFAVWISYTLPLFLLLFPAMIIVLTLYFKPDRSLTIGQVVPYANTGTSNKSLAIIFGITVVLWTSESIIAPMLGIAANFSSLVALLAIILIFVAKVLTWDEIIDSIQWKVLMLFGGGLTLGYIIDSSGLGAVMIESISHIVGEVPLLLFIWIVVICTVVITEFMSNTASAALLLPLLFTMAKGLQIDPVILILPATIAASLGFMLPVGTPPNAMVFATGLIRQGIMIRVGFILNLVCSLIVATYFYFILIFMD